MPNRVFPRFLPGLLAGVLTALCTLPAHADPTRQWNQGDPTAEEQYALEWLNLTRKDPVGTMTYLCNLYTSDSVIEAMIHYLAGGPPGYPAWIAAQIQYVQTQQTTLSNLAATQPKSYAFTNEPLALYPLFQQQASTLSQLPVSPGVGTPSDPTHLPPTYLYPLTTFNNGGDSQKYSGPNATGGTAVFGLYGGTYSHYPQSRFYNSLITGREWAFSLLLNFGGYGQQFVLYQGDPLPNGSFGHTRMAGIKLSTTPDQNRLLTLYLASNEFLTASDLPFGASTVFITGVAYRDSNNNGHYDIAEGLAGAKIMPDKGDWFSVTSSSGGYSIPVAPDSGAYNLTVTTGPLTGAKATVSITSGNVKVDWSLPPLPKQLPTQVNVPVPSGSTQFTALSTRGLVENGNNNLIGGIVITGNPNIQKKLLIRGVGPTLLNYGINNYIGATQLQVFDTKGNLLSSNGYWQNYADAGAAVAAAAASVGDFPLLKTGAQGGDTALIVSLPPGGYTAVVSPLYPNSSNATGSVGLLEIFDLARDQGVLADISTRAHVGTGTQQLIVGCSVAGSGSKRLIVRGVGPQLAANFIIPGTLENPQLTLFDSNGNNIAYNDDWSVSTQTTQLKTLSAAVGLSPLNDNSVDSALLSTIGPGNWTAIVSASANTTFTGIALVELYDAP